MDDHNAPDGQSAEEKHKRMAERRNAGYESMLPVFAARASMRHIIVAGRNAPAPLIAAADLVSDVHVAKHHYKDQGVKAQRGIEL